MSRSGQQTHHHSPESLGPVRRAAVAIASPIQRILAIEAASGVLLLAVTAVALVWANASPASYEGVWHTPIGGRLGSWSFERPLHFWINDGLMTVFFFVVGLEIRREMSVGELASVRKAALPLAAAIGGMLLPATIFAVLNIGREGAAAWAVPMATDIAFAVGVLTILGSRVPPALRVLLLALAVLDDIGAILVITLFFGTGISAGGFVVLAIGIAFLLAMRSGGVRTPVMYVVPSLIIWIGMMMVGVHPTLSGVIVGLLTPVRPSPSEAESPAERLIHALHPWVAAVVMPIFALANAGVVLGGARLSGDHLWLFLGIVLGLTIGKPLGIIAAALGATRLRVATRTDDISARGLTLVGLVGGIGFTMSLFIAALALPEGAMLDTAKLAILVGSGIAILVGLVHGLITHRPVRP